MVQLLHVLHSFPSRRSSDLPTSGEVLLDGEPITTYAVGALRRRVGFVFQRPAMFTGTVADNLRIDRKSTRLNSSHVENSYAVFCLKKKMRTLPTASVDPNFD